MNRKESIIVGALLIATFFGSAFAAPAIQNIMILNDPLNVKIVGLEGASATSFFSRPVTFAITERTGQFPTPVWTLWNFTVDMAGRDPGSTWITFKVLTGGVGVWLVKSEVDLLSENPASNPYSAQAIAAFMFMRQGTWSWRVPESGRYTLYEPIGLLSDPFSPGVPALTAVETWTVTSITFGR